MVGQCTFFKFYLYSKWLHFKAYALQRYSDKNHKFLLVKYLDHEERACIVCMSQYMRFGLIAYLQKSAIIVYFGVSRRTRCLKVVWSILQHPYFVYARCKS